MFQDFVWTENSLKESLHGWNSDLFMAIQLCPMWAIVYQKLQKLGHQSIEETNIFTLQMNLQQAQHFLVYSRGV